MYYLNNKDGTFQEVGLEAGVAVSNDGFDEAGMRVSAGDFNHDGFLDIFKTNFIDDTPNLYRNNGDGTFSDVFYQAIGALNRHFMGWGCGFFDYDNDSWADIDFDTLNWPTLII